MNQVLLNIFGINYRTSILSIGVIVSAGTRIFMAFRAKNYNFPALAEDGQLIMNTLASLFAAWGLYVAKDSKVAGAGAQAVAVHDSGDVTNINGDLVDKQSTTPPAPMV